MAECYHLIGTQAFEESAVVGRDIVRVLLFLNVLGKPFSEIFLRSLETYLVGLVGEKQVEIVDAQAIHLDDFSYIEMAKDVEHAIDAIERVEGWVIHRSQSN